MGQIFSLVFRSEMNFYTRAEYLSISQGSRYEIISNFPLGRRTLATNGSQESSIFNLLGVAGVAGAGVFPLTPM